MKFIKNRMLFLESSSQTVDNYLSKKSNQRDIDIILSDILKSGDLSEAKRLFDNMDSYYQTYLRDCLSIDKEFTEYVFSKNKDLFLTKKAKFSSYYDISNARNSFNLIKFGSDKTPLIISDIFKKSFHRAIFEMFEFSIDQKLPNIFNEICKRFGVENDLKVIEPGDLKTTKYNLKLLEIISRYSDRIKSIFNMSITDVLDKYPHLLNGLTDNDKIKIVKVSPNKDEVLQFLFGSKITTNVLWKVIINPNNIRIGDVKEYIDKIKRNHNSKGVKNLLKIKDNLIKKEFIQLFKDEGVLKVLANDIAKLWMNSIAFMTKFMEGKHNMLSDSEDSRLIEEGKELIELLVSSNGVTKEDIAKHLINNFDPYKEGGINLFHNSIGRKVSMRIEDDDIAVSKIKQFLMYLMETNTELGAKYAIDNSKLGLSDMSQSELNKLMDKALDDRDFTRAKEIGKFLKN